MREDVLDYLVESMSIRDGNRFMLNEKIDDVFDETMRKLDIPTYRCSAESIGYNDWSRFQISDILKELLEKTNGDIQKAQKAVVIIEDFEQLSMDERFMPQLVSEGTNIDLDSEKYRRCMVQSLLIPFLQGEFPFEYQGNNDIFDTKGLTIIMTGDFKDLDERSILNGYDGALWHRLCPIFREVEIEKENNK